MKRIPDIFLFPISHVWPQTLRSHAKSNSLYCHCYVAAKFSGKVLCKTNRKFRDIFGCEKDPTGRCKSNFCTTCQSIRRDLFTWKYPIPDRDRCSWKRYRKRGWKPTFNDNCWDSNRSYRTAFLRRVIFRRIRVAHLCTESRRVLFNMPQLLETKHTAFSRDEPTDVRYVYLNAIHKLAWSLREHRKAEETYIHTPNTIVQLCRVSCFVNKKYPLLTNCSVPVRSKKGKIEIVWVIFSIVPTIYLSTTTVTDLLDVTNQVIEDNILDEIRCARVIAIVSDEGTDINRHGNIRLYVWCCDQSSGEPTETFLTLLKLTNRAAKSIFEWLVEEMEHWQIHLVKIRSAAFDRTAAFNGVRNGVYAARIRLSYDCSVLFIHCGAHVLQLAVVSASNDLPEISESLVALKSLRNFINKSSLHLSRFEDMQQILQNRQLKLVRPGDTRWFASSLSFDLFCRLENPPY